MKQPGAFEQRLSDDARQVEERLGTILGALSRRTPDRLLDAMSHAMMTGGKRFRPFLVLETARVAGGDAAAALDVAAALECVHGYSLVHDDLPSMDNDRLRRGQPTVWAKFDEWTAILAGDALLTLAFEILAETGLPAATALALTRELAAAAGPRGMVGGQALDLAADKLKDPETPTEDHVRRLQGMKTGALIVFACRAGGLIAEADTETLRALTRFGEALGLAFQIADDLLDAVGETAVTGKRTGKDAGQGKATLVGLKGVDEAHKLLLQTERAAIEELQLLGERAVLLQQAACFVSARRR